MWQESKEACPICSNLLSELFDYMNHTLMEHHQRCDSCKSYFFDYATGNTEVHVGDKEWAWWHLTPQKEIEEIMVSIDNAISQLKLNRSK